MSNICVNTKLNKDVYSTEEVKTNKIYIDENGKEWPIYRKEYVFDGLSSVGSSYSNSLSNIIVLECRGFINRNNNNDLEGPYYYSSTDRFRVFSRNNSEIVFRVGDNNINDKYKVILEYIKTTD